jgi:excisionase family DNA binding protein
MTLLWRQCFFDKGQSMLTNMLSIAEAAKVLGVSPYTIRRLIDSGDIRAVNVGARVVIASNEIERVILHGAGQARDEKNHVMVSETAQAAKKGI